MNADELYEQAQRCNDKRKVRIIDLADCEEMIELVEKYKDDPKVHTIRIYPIDAFVPNSYKYRCDQTYLQATKDANGWHVGAGIGDAKRSHGRGPRVTINNRSLVQKLMKEAGL